MLLFLFIKDFVPKVTFAAMNRDQNDLFFDYFLK
ncbi:hypothetical protein BSn5_03865 [Bacillus subtilis BSn5]|nr:hypothetical protein BSn5_03865 [Bacillus subtilis BSn5]